MRFLRFYSITAMVSVMMLFSGCLSATSIPTDERVVFTPETLRKEFKRIAAIDPLTINPDDYPQVLGQYSKDGRTLVVQYFCSDVCPQYGGLWIVYEDIETEADCADISGEVARDAAWGGFIGCVPVIE